MSSRRCLVGAAIAIGALSVTAYVYWRFRTIGVLVTPLRMGQYCPGEIALRTVSAGSDLLLISTIPEDDVTRMSFGRRAVTPSDPVYRFTPKIAELEPSRLDEWAQATGLITFRYSDRDFSIKPLELETLHTVGAYALDKDVSPDRKYVSVVSANAPRGKGSFMFFFGGGGGAYPLGPFYHETFDRLTGAKVGPTYTLEYPGERVSLSYCWEAQGKYIVYHDMQGRFLWVVPGPNLASAEANLKQASTAGSTSVEKTHD